MFFLKKERKKEKKCVDDDVSFSEAASTCDFLLRGDGLSEAREGRMDGKRTRLRRREQRCSNDTRNQSRPEEPNDEWHGWLLTPRKSDGDGKSDKVDGVGARRFNAFSYFFQPGCAVCG